MSEWKVELELELERQEGSQNQIDMKNSVEHESHLPK